ncbi:restriction endonuclease [Glutamicibacter creatinolyticus]|uniref:restriction endonuclease n=1 Tax=Glutamicibacter creatinolyticus TaxID=162496 RepID=UPI0031CE3D08
MKRSEEIYQEAKKYVESNWNSGNKKLENIYGVSQSIADNYLPPLGPRPTFHDHPAWPGVLWLMGSPGAIALAGFISPTTLSFFLGFIIWSLLLWLINDLLKREAFAKNKKHRKWIRLEKDRCRISDEFQHVAQELHKNLLQEHEQKMASIRRAQELEESLKRPLPVINCTHQQAEYLAAQWMRFLGEGDAKVSQATRDGGFDVESSNFVVEVKHHATPVGPSPVRALAGVAGAKKKIGAFFSLRGYSKEAIKFGCEASVLLFSYDPENGTIKGMTPVSEIAALQGLPSVLQDRI